MECHEIHEISEIHDRTRSKTIFICIYNMAVSEIEIERERVYFPSGA